MSGKLCLAVQLGSEAGYRSEPPEPICNSASVLLHSVWFPFSFLVNVPFEKFQPCFIELGGCGGRGFSLSLPGSRRKLKTLEKMEMAVERLPSGQILGRDLGGPGSKRWEKLGISLSPWHGLSAPWHGPSAPGTDPQPLAQTLSPLA